MRSVALIILVFSFLLLSATYASAAGEIEIIGEDAKSIRFGESVRFDFVVKNNMNKIADAIALIDGENLAWVTADKYFFFIPQLSETPLSLVVFPQDNGTHEYTLTVQSVSNPSIHDSKTITIEVMGNKAPAAKVGDKTVRIFGSSSRFSDGKITFSATIENPSDNALRVDIYLKNRKGRILSTETRAVEPNSTAKIKASFSAENLLAGRYSVEVVIRGLGASETRSVTIPEIRNVKKTKKVMRGFLYETVAISVENLGNVIERDYSVTEKTDSAHYVTWDVAPTQTSIEDGMLVSTWLFGSLGPKDKIVITYTIHYWFFLLKLIIGILIIIAAVMVVYMKLSKPSIKKKYVKKGHNEYLVILEVKGSFFYPIKSVLVKDALSPLTKLVEKFEGVSPAIRKKEGRVELLWRIGTMKRMDERILSYTIKSVVEAQIKLPPATLRYKTAEDGDKKRVHSNEVELE